MSSYKFTPRAVASPDAPQKPLARKRARSGGAQWVRVARHEPGSQAKNPRSARSQPPACSHKEHDILTTAEATAFAAQFWDQKMHPTKASQHEFLATCIDVDVEKNVKYNNYEKYTIKRGHRTKYFVPYRGMRREICKTQFLHYFGISRFVVQSVAKTKAAAAMSNPLSPMKSPSKKAASNTTRSSPIKVKFEKFLQSLPQADNRCSDAARPHTETVHLAPIGGRRASAYNVWVHWLRTEEAEQFAKRGKVDFKPLISLKTVQRTMRTYKLGFQPPMKDACAECELYNLQIRTASPALKVALLWRRAHFLRPFYCPLYHVLCLIFRRNFSANRPPTCDLLGRSTSGTNTMGSTASRPGVQPKFLHFQPPGYVTLIGQSTWSWITPKQ